MADPRLTELYPAADTWGPKGPPVWAVLADDHGAVWLFSDTLPADAGGAARANLLTRATAAWATRDGFVRFFGSVLDERRAARAWEHCVSLPEGPWWEL